MRQTVRTGLAALIVAALAPLAFAIQDPAATGNAPVRPAPTPAQLAKLNEVLATVNGEPITRGQLLQLLNQYTINPGSEKTAYTTALEILVNTRLLTQFLKSAKVQVPPADVEAVIAEQEKKARENGTSLTSALADSGTTMDALKDEITRTLQWREFIKSTANDDRLKRYLKDNLDAFDGAQVKASHIQINLEPTASAADKEKARQKLLQIKKDVEAGKITFADAANKYSEDPANVDQPSGGDLRYFPRKRFTEPFAVAAFSTPPGKISDPVETEYGMHIIYVADRKPGRQVEFERYKEAILNQFAVDEQNRIVAEKRKTAKIDIKPMPADLFPKAPAAEEKAPATAPAEKAKAKG